MLRKFFAITLISLLLSGCAGSGMSKESDKDILKSPCINIYK